MNFENEIKSSINYLSSDAAIKTVESDPYWPKWNSPWWHMLLLHEMGETKKIPRLIVEKYIASLNRIPLKIFPIHQHEMSEGVDPWRGSPCHCQLGNVYQVLAAYGIDVDQELPWIRPWFLRYQMADGGLNCDNDAYLVKDETPSSMVGTIAAFEAILLYTPRNWTPEEIEFLEKCAKFLINRKLKLGSDTKHNPGERVSAEKWMQLCFPRYYLYDVLRGLNALLIWSDKTKNKISADAIHDVVGSLKTRFPEGQIKIQRQSFEGVGTITENESGEWIRKQPASFFPLLNIVSKTDDVSPFLTKQWFTCLDYIEKHRIDL